MIRFYIEFADLIMIDSVSVTELQFFCDINPTIIRNLTQIQSDWNQVSSSEVDYIKNKPNLATVATSGSYNDLSNKLSNGDFEVYSLALSDETSNLSVGTAKISFHWPFNFTLTSLFIEINTAPTGSILIVDINNNSGSSIFITRVSIDIGEYTSLTAATAYILANNPTSFTKGDLCTIDLDQIGATIAGKGLKIHFIGIKS